MSDALTAKDLAHFRARLEALRTSAQETRDRTEREALDESGSSGGPDAQGGGESNTEFEEVDLDVIELEDATARAAAEALRRIADGTYGRCAACGGWIARARLEAVPTTTHCRACQEKSE